MQQRRRAGTERASTVVRPIVHTEEIPMRTPASIAGHPIHPMLVTLPIGLWVFSLVADLYYAFGAGTAAWKTVAFYTMAGGLVGALAAAIPGLIDLLSLPSGDIKSTAIKHMAINLTVVALYAINLWLRAATESLGTAGGFGIPEWLSLIAIGLLLVSGWLGGKMVYEAGVGVSTTDDALRR
jgi:uncharacterized membrane protein